MTDAIQELAQRPVIVVLRAGTDRWLLPAIDELVELGFDNLEVTLTTPGAVAAISAAAAAHPGALIGAGTVRSAAQAEAAVAAGARYLVSQVTDAGVHAFARSAGVPYIPGGLTPNEIVDAWSLGVDAVKVSPIGPLGGISYLSELRGPLPEIPLMPTGGVRIEDVTGYLAAGAVAVGVSRHLLGDVLEDGDMAGLRRRAGALREALDAAGLALSTVE
ncbi:bifunctional 4-hydroxy-2-oxoglutarate aldolase/2-dehydro-3-deoxy-phosphogluconate aldolase [Microbacterium sp. NPDC058342]|uniref:bifunctional 4-hydroxy-2-oxoglutarate aldolase/2-dehydro-3-deoxy-phosphogluconate aldolase n=1 Tax=Microbacterium sp. NPDC058342 TaxID=3346454 RepID=UPI0036522216